MKATEYSGFLHIGDEGKVMGLSSHGNYRKYLDIFRNIVVLKPDGTYKLNKKYFTYSKITILQGKFRLSSYFYKKLGPARKKNEPLNKRHQDIAAALQKITEETVFHLISYLKDKTKEENLYLSGGVTLNSVANGKIHYKTGFKNIFIQPVG
jgi:carbamoyltransferase